MKKRKLLSLFLAFCLVLGLLPATALAAYPEASGAGFKLVTDSYTDGVLTVTGQVKLPTADGISSFNVLLAYDSTKLTLLKKNDNNTKYTPTETKTTYKLAVAALLTNGETEEKFGVSEADLYGKDGRAGFKINLYSDGGSIASEKTTDWVSAFTLKFEVNGKPADAATVLDSDSLRIADPVKDAVVIKGAFPANNNYCIQVTDAATPAKIYSFGKMAENTDAETADNNFIMSAEGNNTATYPGSTNTPPKTPPTCTAPSGVAATYGQALSEITLTNPSGNTPGTWSWKSSADLVGDVGDRTHKATFTPTDAETYATVEDIDVTVTVSAKSISDVTVDAIPDQGYTGTQITPEVTVKGDGGKLLVKDKDYTVAYGTNIDVGSDSGAVTVKAKSGGNYSFTDVTVKFNIVAAASTISIAGNPSKTYDGTAVANPKVSKTGSTGAVTYTYYTDSNCTAETTTADGAASNGAAPKNAGTYWVKATVAADANYGSATSGAQQFTISRADYSYSYTGTTTTTVGSAMPTTDSTATGTGANSEAVSGILTWYTDENRTVPTSGNFATTGEKTLYWKFVASNTNYVTTEKTGTVTFTVNALPSQSVAFADAGPISKTYGDGVFSNTATNSTTGGGTITYESSNTAVATVDSETGAVTIKGAGSAIITATAAGTSSYSETQVSYTLNVSPKALGMSDLEYKSGSKTKTYDGSATATGIVVGVKDSSLVNPADVVNVTGSAAYDNENAGTGKTITFTSDAITSGNYRLDAGLTVSITGASIDAKPVTVTVNEASRKYGEANPTFTGSVTPGALATGDTYDGLGMSFTTAATATSDVGKYDVTGSGTNSNYNITVSGTEKLSVTAATPTYTVSATQNIKVGSDLSVYTAIAPEKGTGVSGADVAGTTTWYSDEDRTVAAQESDVSGLAVDATKTLYWKFEPTSANYSTVTGQTVFTIVEGDPQTLTFAEASKTVTYGDSAFTNLANNDRSDGGEISYVCSNTAVAEVNVSTGEVTIKGSGTAVITASAEAVTGKYAAGTKSYTLTVNPRSITVTVNEASRKYGEANPTFTGSVTSGTLAAGDTYDGLGMSFTTAATATSDVGKYDVTGSGTNSNYNITVSGTEKLTVTKADAPTGIQTTQSIGHKYSLSGAQTVAFPAGLPTDKGTTTYAVSDINNSNGVLTGTTTVDENGVVTYTLAGQSSYTAGLTASFKVTATMANYESVTVTYTITLTNKDTPVVEANDITVTYTGAEIPVSAITGTAKFGDADVPGSWSWKTTAPENVTDSSDSVTVVFTPTDAVNYEAVEDTIKVTINKATPTGTPAYTAITTSGKTLADAALTIGSITPAGGSIAWDLGDSQTVSANTAYNWTYTPADTANYNNLTGSITPYVVSSSGGSSGGGVSTYAITVDSAKNGTVTVSPKSAAKGATVTITVKPDKGFELDTLKVVDKNGDKVKVTEKNGKYSFTMPASKVTVKATFAEVVAEPENPFVDVPANAYYYDAVLWAAENGITGGVDATHFAPNATCTRAQAVTFLWRAAGSPAPKSSENPFTDVKAGSYYYDAVLWAVENGITNGTSATAFSPNATCSRAQIVTFLWRSQKSPAADTVNPFTDVAADSYYANAVVWAAENGITGGTSATTFSPNNNCTRAQIVTFLFRCLGE